MTSTATDTIPEEPLPQFDNDAVIDLPEMDSDQPETTKGVTEPSRRSLFNRPNESANGRTRTRTYSPGGDPKEVAKVISGLTVIVLSTMAMWLQRKGKHLRMPDQKQRDDFARPLASILVRHLPLTEIGPDLADLTAAATAAHNYVAGSGEPLVTRIHAELALPDQEDYS